MRPQRATTSRPAAFAFALLSLLAAAAARPQLAVRHSGEPGPWIRLDTEHFTLFSNGPADAARSTAYDLEELRSVLLQIAPGSTIDSPLPTFLYLFTDETSFAPYRLGGTAVAEGPQNVGEVAVSAGYLVPNEHGNYAALMIDAETRPVSYVYQQYVHRVLHDQLPALPPWLSYGLAEYFSNFEVAGGEALIGRPIRRHRDRLLHQDGTGVAELLAGDELADDVLPGSWFLARSWALVHYLRSTPELRRQLAAFARQVHQVPAGEAFERAFDFDVATLEERLASYVRQTEFRYLRVTIDRQAHPVRVFDLAEHEGVYHLGDLLARAHPRRGDEAAEHFRRVLARAPWHGLSHAGLGYLAERAGDDRAALDHYRRAVERAANDHLVQYLYGRRLGRSFGGRRPEGAEEEEALTAAIAALSRAVELKPDFAPAWAELGYARNLEPEASPEAQAALERALELLPGRLDVAMNLLLAHARLGDRERAEAVVAGMRRLGADAALLERAREVELRMDFREAGRLARRGRLDDAVALFARIAEESRDPELRQLAAEQRAKLEPAAEVRR